jgi:hypothetical protein
MSFKKRKKVSLKEYLDYRVASEVTLEAVDEFLIALDCPRSLTVHLLLHSGEHAQLANLEFDPLHYSDVWSCRDAYAATKLLSKYKDLTLDYDLDSVAIEKFQKFESLCGRTNARFRDLSKDPLFKGPIVWLHNAVIRKIEGILGCMYGEELISLANWGPGATTLVRARDASAANKFQFETGITRDLYAFIPHEIMGKIYPLWSQHLSDVGFPRYQIGNKVVTVPKDATTNRVIAAEPGINLWFQKALGEMIGKRLRRFGIDLRYQTTNQNLARCASISGDLATVDLSSASDSISEQVVTQLIPWPWLSILDSTRSRYGLLDETLLRWNKFSSMGNGFTFQLESLIFFAAADCCREYLHIPRFNANRQKNVSVYGDDVIIPVRCLALFSSLLEFYGFILNVKKSHSSSPFRESCGAHYYAGIDVKPIYLKGSLSTVASVYRFANAIRRFAHRRMGNLACDARFRKVFDLLVQSVPESLRLRIPDGLGDGGFISNFDEATPIRARHWIEGFRVRHITHAAKRREMDVVGLLLARLWVTSLEEERNTVPLRDRTMARISSSIVQQWHDLGPWL